MDRERAETVVNVIRELVASRAEDGHYNFYSDLGGGAWTTPQGEEGRSIRSVLQAFGADVRGDEEVWSAGVKHAFESGGRIITRTFVFHGGRRASGADATREWVEYERHEDHAGGRRANAREQECRSAAG